MIVDTDPVIPNEAPVANNDAVGSVQIGETITFTVTDNDVDSDNNLDPTSVLITSDPGVGMATVNPNGTITYTHTGSTATIDTLSYTVQDTEGAVSNAATVSITISDPTIPNVAPVATNDEASVQTGEVVTIPVLVNDNDSDGSFNKNSLTVVSSAIYGGTAIDFVTGEINYTHDGSDSSSDTFTYTVEDDESAVSNIAIVTININEVSVPNVAPVAQNDTAELSEPGQVITIEVTANDDDSDGSLALDSVIIDTAPLNGTAVVDSVTGQITYTHDGSATTSDSFTYTVADNEGAVSNVATVTINLETSSCVFAANNRVLNGSFEENLTDWVYHNNGSGTTAVTMVDPYHCDFAAKLDFNSPGNNVQLYQQNIPLDAATSYRFTFAARATTPRSITVYLHKHTAPYSNYGINAFTANLTTEWQTFTFDFQSSGFTGSVSDARLRFWLTTAQPGDTFFIDDVVIQKTE